MQHDGTRILFSFQVAASSLDRAVENPPAFILWVGHKLGRTPWPLTGVHGSESGMARVCESKELSLERQ